MRVALYYGLAAATACDSSPALAWTTEVIDKAIAALDTTYQPLQDECSCPGSVLAFHMFLDE